MDLILRPLDLFFLPFLLRLPPLLNTIISHNDFGCFFPFLCLGIPPLLNTIISHNDFGCFFPFLCLGIPPLLIDIERLLFDLGRNLIGIPPLLIDLERPLLDLGRNLICIPPFIIFGTDLYIFILYLYDGFFLPRLGLAPVCGNLLDPDIVAILVSDLGMGIVPGLIAGLAGGPGGGLGGSLDIALDSALFSGAIGDLVNPNTILTERAPFPGIFIYRRL